MERQQDLSVEPKTGIGGVRTFPLIALAGAMSAFISQVLGVWPIIATLLILGGLLAVAYDKEWGRKDPPGIITPLAALITFLLGVLALLPALPIDAPHRYLLIVGSAGVVMALLSLKERLHHVVQQVSDDDIYATAKFVILALVVLPLLPNRTFGPLDVLNPFHTGIMVVLIAGVSFWDISALASSVPIKALPQQALWEAWSHPPPSPSAWPHKQGNTHVWPYPERQPS
ncbi:MAG: MgtC/SapB family protein [Nitrospirales bacterium]|nr:MgtC/SapB family protein [Nitrospirales bacterium]